MNDFLARRSDVDAARVGLWGVSLGGYYAPRAAAFDQRIKACIALSGPYDWGEVWDGLPELTREAFDEDGYYRMGDVVTFVDRDKPEEGLAFAGRVAEEFKLQSGIFVRVGTLRVEVVSCTAPLGGVPLLGAGPGVLPESDPAKFGKHGSK